MDRSTLGCYFSLGSTMTSWYNRNKNLVEITSVDAKYMKVSLVSYEAI